MIGIQTLLIYTMLTILFKIGALQGITGSLILIIFTALEIKLQSESQKAKREFLNKLKELKKELEGDEEK